MVTSGSYDEALQRFHETGPEFKGWLSNHGPMAVEALARRDSDHLVHPWTDAYLKRLDDRPRGITPIDPRDWREALGQPSRSGDWIELMLRQVREEAWRDVLVRWWPFLLPGVVAGATHGVIRVGHAVQALTTQETEPRVEELAHALAYWAARWQPLPGVTPTGRRPLSDSLDLVPRVPDQSGGIGHRVAQLHDDGAWSEAIEAADLSGDAVTRLHDLVDDATQRYLLWAYASPTMLVHAVTAPAAIARVVPVLPPQLHAPSAYAAWAAAGAVVAAYRPSSDRDHPDLPDRTADETWHDAVTHGGEHVIKLADAALASDARTQRTAGARATALAIRLDA